MSRIAALGLVSALSAALAVSGLTRSAPAEEAYDPEDTVYATGAVFETEDELADVPRTPLFRAYLPPSVDLSGRFPPAGDQGEQGSCVGWAVGYAARSYYNSPAGGCSARGLRADRRDNLLKWLDIGGAQLHAEQQGNRRGQGDRSAPARAVQSEEWVVGLDSC